MVELALSRLRSICPKLQIWGIPATIGNLNEAMDILLGDGHRGKLVRADLKKDTYMLFTNTRSQAEIWYHRFRLPEDKRTGSLAFTITGKRYCCRLLAH